ncbi:MAG: SDR family oxidoreductase [Planctomycetota bacterium]
MPPPPAPTGPSPTRRPPSSPPRPILITGATGYIGGRLAPRLLERGHRVRCLARDPGKLRDRPWANAPGVELLAGDLKDPAQLRTALRGCGAAYYLVHSMLSVGPDYAAADQDLARTFAAAAADADMERILYLGGLGELGQDLSEHLRSRRQVEAALAEGPVPVTSLRAAMIIGSGSASFEILRYLVERLPVMITPRWVATRCQPIAVADVLDVLVHCLETPSTTGQTLDIGGPDVLTYQQLLQLTAELLGLPRRWVVPVPVLTPRLSSLWIHLVTPISARIARPLTEGLRNEVVVRDRSATSQLPAPQRSARDAIAAALGKTATAGIETRWSDAGRMPGDPDWAGGTVFTDPRTSAIAAPAAAVFRAVCRVGGGHGWYAGDWLWRLRGGMDRLIGGPGLRRGRRHPERVTYGEALDFWRVTAHEPNRRLELRAEMKLPGVATLTFEIAPDPGSPNHCVLTQTARFKPRGLLGLAYWYAVLPLHGYVFRGMLRGIERGAIAHGANETSHPPPAPAANLPR